MAGSEPAVQAPRSQLLVLLLLAVIVYGAFSPAFDVYLAGDDFEWLDAAYEIPKDPLSSFELINTMWRPVVKWSFLVDYLVFGRNSIGYRATDLSIHLINACLLWMLLDRMLGVRWIAAAAALAFALSPLHSEAVLWASCRGDTLLLTSWLAAWLVLIVVPIESKWADPALVLFAAVGAGCKESWVVFPLISALFIVWVLGRAPSEAWRRTRWLWVALALYLAIFVVVPALSGDSTPAYYADFSLWPAIVKLCRLVVIFCGLGPVVTMDSAAVVVAALIVTAAVTLAVRQRNAAAQWAIALTAATLALAAPFPGVVLRHNYLPLAGFWMTLALVVEPLVAGSRARRFRSAVFASAAVAVLVIEGLAVQLEIRDYRLYGELHRRLCESYSEVEDRIPRNSPLVLVDRSSFRGVEFVADRVQGVDKTFFVRRDALWQMVFLPPLANFLGQPFDQRLVRASFDPSLGLEDGHTVLFFDDGGFSLRPDLLDALADATKSWGTLPPGVSVYRFIAE